MGSLGMLNQARKEGIFREYIRAMVDELGSIPINGETYDVVLCSNGFAPGQIYPSAIPEILRTMRDGYGAKSQRFGLLDAEISNLSNTGAAELVVGPVVFDNFCLDDPGKFYMLRKTPRHHIAYQQQEDVSAAKKQ